MILILKGGDRCLRFQLFLSYPTGTERTTLKVIIKDGSTVKSTHSFTDATGYKWREVSIDLPAVNDLKVSSSSPTKAGDYCSNVHKNFDFEFLVLKFKLCEYIFFWVTVKLTDLFATTAFCISLLFSSFNPHLLGGIWRCVWERKVGYRQGEDSAPALL